MATPSLPQVQAADQRSRGPRASFARCLRAIFAKTASMRFGGSWASAGVAVVAALLPATAWGADPAPPAAAPPPPPPADEPPARPPLPPEPPRVAVPWE